VDIHPIHPFLICIGKYDGNVAVYNVQSPEKVPQYESNSVTNKHCGTVWQVTLKQISVFSLCPFCFLLSTVNTWPYLDIYSKIFPEYAVENTDQIVLEFMDKVHILIPKTDFFFTLYEYKHFIAYLHNIPLFILSHFIPVYIMILQDPFYNYSLNYLYIYKYASWGFQNKIVYAYFLMPCIHIICPPNLCTLIKHRMVSKYAENNTNDQLLYLTLILLTWRKWWAPNNASKQQMGFNSAFKGLNDILLLIFLFCVLYSSRFVKTDVWKSPDIIAAWRSSQQYAMCFPSRYLHA